MNKKSIYQFSENTLSLFSIKAIELGLTIFLIPYLILKVGMVNYGHYAFAMAFIFIFTNVLNYGFNITTVRELVKNKHNTAKISELFSEVMSVKLVLFGFLYVCILIVILCVPKFQMHKALYLYASLILVGELFSLRWFFLGIEEMKFKALINLISTLLYVGLVLFFVKELSDYKYILLYQAIGIILVAIISFGWVLRAYKIKLHFISFKKVISYLIVNFSAFVNLVLPSTFGIMVVFLVGILGLPQHVSFMQIGVKITSAFSTLNTVLSKVFYSMVNRNNTAMLHARRMLLTIGMVLSIGMFLSSNILISTWLHSETITVIKTSIILIKILSPIPFLMAVIASFGVNGLLVFYKDLVYGKITFIASLVVVIVAIFTIPAYHFYGGAIALLAGRMVHAGVSYVYFKKNLNG